MPIDLELDLSRDFSVHMYKMFTTIGTDIVFEKTSEGHLGARRAYNRTQRVEQPLSHTAFERRVGSVALGIRRTFVKQRRFRFPPFPNVPAGSRKFANKLNKIKLRDHFHQISRPAKTYPKRTKTNKIYDTALTPTTDLL